MYTLMYGQTWYGKNGYTLCDNVEYNIDKIDLGNYNANKFIMNNLKLKKFPLMKKYLETSLKNVKSGNIIFDKVKIMELYKYFNDNDLLLKNFIKEFLLNFDETCLLFNSFYEELYNELNLKDFYGHFYMKIV
jgi:hypothetical protein